MQFAGMQFAGVDQDSGAPLFRNRKTGKVYCMQPAEAAGMDFAGRSVEDFLAGDDFAGNDDFAGMDFAGMDFAGAGSAANLYKRELKRAEIRQAAEARARQTPKVFNESPKNKAVYQFGFDSGPTLIAPGGIVNLSVQPQMIMKIRKLSSSNTGWLLLDFKVGTRSQFAANGPIQIEAFSPQALGNDVVYEVVQNGYSVQVSAQNIGGTSSRFGLTCFGDNIF